MVLSESNKKVVNTKLDILYLDIHTDKDLEDVAGGVDAHVSDEVATNLLAQLTIDPTQTKEFSEWYQDMLVLDTQKMSTNF